MSFSIIENILPLHIHALSASAQLIQRQTIDDDKFYSYHKFLYIYIFIYLFIDKCNENIFKCLM